MKSEPNLTGIIDTLKKATTELSARGVIHYADYENTSENIQWIQDQMFDLVEAGIAMSRLVTGHNGGWFFRLGTFTQ